MSVESKQQQIEEDTFCFILHWRETVVDLQAPTYNTANEGQSSNWETLLKKGGEVLNVF